MDQDSGLEITSADLPRIRALAEAGKLEMAGKLALSLSDDLADKWHYLGWIYTADRKFPEARAAFEKCVGIAPGHHAAWFNIGNLKAREGDREGAKDAYAKVKELLPDAAIPRLDKVIVFLAIPTYRDINAETMLCLMDMMMTTTPQDNIQFHICHCSGSRITSNRNNLVKRAREHKATHIFFIDADMTFKSNSIQRLLAHDKDIVCATTCRRGDEDGKPIGQAVNQKENEEQEMIVTGGLIEMALVGSCFMLIKMEVFDKIGLPAYYEPPNYDIEDADGEDITFCKLARDKGYKIWLDFDISKELGHIGTQTYRIKPRRDAIPA